MKNRPLRAGRKQSAVTPVAGSRLSQGDVSGGQGHQLTVVLPQQQVSNLVDALGYSRVGIVAPTRVDALAGRLQQVPPLGYG